MRFTRLATAVLAGALVAASPAYAGATPPSSPRASASSSHAKAALERVQELFRVKSKRHARGDANAPVVTGLERPDATMALRDLAMRLDSLSPADRKVAERYFARPTDRDDPGESDPWSGDEAANSPSCSANPAIPVCVHWTNIGVDAPPITDDDLDLIPDQVETTLATVEHVFQREVTQGGYRKPLPDGTRGGGTQTDIYLAQLADQGLFGYCTLDPDQANHLSAPAYCVVDDDFLEFPAGPLASLQVTVAHEFFHAVQFAYEWAEDLWFMEGTATWIEDEIYDDINDNLNYIRRGSPANPITHPQVPLDRFDGAWRNYGNWVFWKKLGETYPGTAGSGLPVIVRNTWIRAADHRARGASTMALSAELAARHTSFGRVFRNWGVGNRFPARSYAEGAANHYPAAPLTRGGTLRLSRSHRSTTTKLIRLSHMTNAYARFTPKRLTGKHWKLRVTIDAPDKVRGSFATLVVYRKGGGIAQVPVSLNGHGNGVKRVPFGLGSVKYVELTLTNASNRFKSCYPLNFSPYTCGGTPLDEHQRFTFKARVVR